MGKPRWKWNELVLERTTSKDDSVSEGKEEELLLNFKKQLI